MERFVMTGGELGTVLVVEDHARARTTLCEFLLRIGAKCRGCESYAEALAALDCITPDIVLLDVCLGEHTARDVLLELRRRAVLPIVIVLSGEARCADVFELAQLGARTFLPKPVTPEELLRALEHATQTTPDLVPIIRTAVGHISIHDAQSLLRRTMISAALGKAQGNRSGAARVLQISRQLLQHMLRDLSEQPAVPVETTRN
jgi:two-component system, response regulator RegA